MKEALKNNLQRTENLSQTRGNEISIKNDFSKTQGKRRVKYVTKGL